MSSPCVALLGGLLLATPALAEEKPLWELGMGVGALSFPDYRGSDERRNFLMPVPYVVYRGDFIKADKRGVRGTFFDSDRMELSLSASASPPVNSEDNRARAGMDDLEPTVELGPSLELKLWRSLDERTSLDLRLPVRAAVTIKGGPESVGWLFSPTVNVDFQDPAGFNGWNLGLVAGPIWGSRTQHQYFYGVSEQDATPWRPAYEAKAGYGGTQFLAAVSRRYPSYWVGAFLRYDSLQGATFEDSPLVTSKSFAAGGLAISWILGESSERVQVGN